MSWPNSVSTARPLPGFPSTFPGVPANDNWRMPRTNVPNMRPPANDNFPRKQAGLKLPGVARRLPILQLAQLGAAILYVYGTGHQKLVVPGGWQLHSECPANLIEDDIFVFSAPSCGVQFRQRHQYYAGGTAGVWNQFSVGYNIGHYNGNLYRYQRSRDFVWIGPGTPETQPEVWPRFQPDRVVRRAPALEPVVPYPGFYPPLMNPPFGAPPPLRPGLYIPPAKIMPEWPDAGYRAPDDLPLRKETYLPSRRPPSRTKERKVRAKDYAIGRTIEWLVSQSTEGLDFQRALFEALPWWRKIALYNAARQLETRYADGRIVAGRLHYRDLTPIEKAQAIYDYIDEIDAAKAVENAVKMQLTDMFWAEIGQRMGRYQTGPWDDHGFDGPPKPEPEWEWYIPDIAPDNFHNHWTYETLVNKRLTQQEAQRIHNRFDQFRSAPYQERKFR